jgi:hypothetical protein
MPWPDWGLAALLALLTVVSRWPVRARLLPTWDAIQFVLALREFDVVKHQPHPPGYILFVAAGRLLAPLVGDPVAVFTVLAVAGSALAVLLVYRLGWGLYDRRTAALAAAGLAASPLFWLHGAVGLSYAAEAALATGVTLACWRVRSGGLVALAGSAVLLGMAGGVRQSLLVLLLPLWLGTAWARFRRWGPVAGGLGLVALAALAWFLPMVRLSGGLARYVEAGLELYGSTVHRTTLAGGGWPWNLVGLGDALVAGLGLSLPLLGWALWRWRRQLVRPGPRAWLLGLWVLPPLGVYVFGHFGQSGYLLAVLPAAYLVVARAVGEAGAALWRRWPRGPAVAAAAFGVVLGAHAAFFVWAPRVDVPFPPASAGWLEKWDAMLRAQYRFRLWSATAGALREREAVVGTYVEAVRRAFDPRDTVLVTELGNGRSYPWFRHVAYYLPEFTVYHLRLMGFSPGYLVAPGTTGMTAVTDHQVLLPVAARRLVWVVDHWDPRLPRPPGLEARPLAEGRWLYVLRVRRGATVEHAGYRLLPVTALARRR